MERIVPPSELVLDIRERSCAGARLQYNTMVNSIQPIPKVLEYFLAELPFITDSEIVSALFFEITIYLGICQDVTREVVCPVRFAFLEAGVHFRPP
jgi:hypothetical protein